MPNTINTDRLPEAIEMLSDFGFFGTEEVSNDLLNNWRKLDREEKIMLIGVLRGATMTVALMKGVRCQ